MKLVSGIICETFGGPMNWYVSVCLLVIVLDILPPGVFIQGIAWLTRPGQITSTAHKNAVFNWTYTAVTHPVNIAWYYKGTNEIPQLTYILGFSSRGIYVPNSAIDSRLEYEKYPESATMVLRDVNFADVGVYESKVSVLDEERVNDVPYITDSATLAVISETALAFTVTIDGLPFKISVANNGTDVHLPNHEKCTVTLDTELDISIQVSSSAPQPESIGIQIRSVSYTYSHHSCVGSHSCERRVQFHQLQITDQGADIVSIINFAIQNLDTVKITQPITFEDTIPSTGQSIKAFPGTVGTTETGITCEPCTEKHCTCGVVAGCVVVICVLAFGLLASVIYYKWKLKKNKTIPVGSEVADELTATMLMKNPLSSITEPLEQACVAEAQAEQKCTLTLRHSPLARSNNII